MTAQLDKRQIEAALHRWRAAVLNWLGEELREAGEERVAASEGLEVSRRNPGEVSSDTVQLLWDNLESFSIRAARLEKVIAEIEEMDLPALVVLFSRSTKLQLIHGSVISGR